MDKASHCLFYKLGQQSLYNFEAQSLGSPRSLDSCP